MFLCLRRKKQNKINNTSRATSVSQKNTALSAGGLEALAEESDGARNATRSLTRCTIKNLLAGGGGQRKVHEVGGQPGGALQYKPIWNVPFSGYRFSA